MASTESRKFKVGDKVKCINAGGQTGLKNGDIYNVIRAQEGDYIWVNRGSGYDSGGIYARRFILVECNFANIRWCLATLRDTTNKQHEMDNCIKALEQLDELDT